MALQKQWFSFNVHFSSVACKYDNGSVATRDEQHYQQLQSYTYWRFQNRFSVLSTII